MYSELELTVLPSRVGAAAMTESVVFILLHAVAAMRPVRAGRTHGRVSSAAEWVPLLVGSVGRLLVDTSGRLLVGAARGLLIGTAERLLVRCARRLLVGRCRTTVGT